MRARFDYRFMTLLAVNVGFWCVLGFQEKSTGQNNPPKLPFANAVEQRFETINELREIKALLKEQNDLLKSGRLKVTVSQ